MANKLISLSEHTGDSNHWSVDDALQFARQQAANTENNHRSVLILLCNEKVGQARYIRANLDDADTVYLMERIKHGCIFQTTPEP